MIYTAKECCISFDSYIKPQLCPLLPCRRYRCISFDSYIKPQLLCGFARLLLVVYLLTPTSNHNPSDFPFVLELLYIF